MKAMLLKRLTTALLLCGFCGLMAKPAEAQAANQIANELVLVVVVLPIVIVGGGISFLIYYDVHHSHFIRGCAVSAQGGLQLQNEGDKQTFMLTGLTPDIKPGDRVRLKGKKSKKDSSGNRSFLVEELVKDYGPCKAAPATP
jgi:hypothetical protein